MKTAQEIRRHKRKELALDAAMLISLALLVKVLVIAISGSY